MPKFVSALALVATMWSVNAHAAPIVYQFTSELAPVAPNTGSNFTGYVEFDSSLLVANTTINVASFSSWAFQWGDDFSWSNSTATFDPFFSSFSLGPALQATGVDLCFSASGICNTAQHPVARVVTNAVAATFDAAGNQNSGLGSWSGPNAVPEPASLAVLGFGLTALGVRRWKRKQ